MAVLTPITSIFHAYGPEDIQRFPNLPQSHLTTLHAIRACRTGAYGTSLSTCPSGGPPHRLDHAGGNRHGPPCQHHTTQLWLHHQLDTQLPGPYVLLAFHRP